MGAADAGSTHARRYDLGVLYADMDVAGAPMKPVDSFRALALRLEEGLTHEDFDLARPFTNGEDGLAFIAARRDVGVLHVDVDSALGACVKSIDAVGVSAFRHNGDISGVDINISPRRHERRRYRRRPIRSC